MVTPMNSWAITMAAIDQCRSLDSRVNRAGAVVVSALIAHLSDLDFTGLLRFRGAPVE
jgi:hypothetical protein